MQMRCGAAGPGVVLVGSVSLVLQSARLTLRPLAARDVDLTVAMMTDPAVMKYWGPVMTEDAAAAKQPNLVRRGGNGGIGIWCVDDRASGEKLGWALLLPMTVDGGGTDWDTVVEDVWPDDDIEVGYMLRPAAWGQGLATEACARMVRFAFEGTPLVEVVGVTHPGNDASQKVLRKCGFSGGGLRRAFGAQLPGFRITRAQWIEQHG